MATAIFWPTQQTNQSRLIANLFNFCIFYLILIKFGLRAKWVVLNHSGDFCMFLHVLDCSGFSAAPAQIKLAAIITIIQTLWLFSSRREPPFVVKVLRTYRPTDQQKEKPSHWDARIYLKTIRGQIISYSKSLIRMDGWSVGPWSVFWPTRSY